MLGEVLQSALSKALNEAVSSTIVENMPPITENLAIEGVICISMSKSQGKQIVVKINDTIEPLKGAWQDTGSGRSSPWKIPLEKIQAAQQRFLNFNSVGDESSNQSESGETSPVDLSRALTSTPNPRKSLAAKKSPPHLIHGEHAVNLPSHVPLLTTVANLTEGKATTKKDNFECKHCSMTISGDTAAFQKHTQVEHKRYLCLFCFHTFSLRCNLMRHERLHFGLKPYVCQLCNNAFTRSTELKTHMQKHGVANEDISTRCSQCSRVFFSSESLAWHMYKVHKETEATYACCICEKLFMEKDEYMKHRQDHANNLIRNGLSYSAVDSSLELNTFADDSDNGQLMIDTQSDVSNCEDEEDISLPNLRHPDENSNSNDSSLLNRKPSIKSPKVVETDLGVRATETATPSPSVCSTGSVGGGSRKRKNKNPTRIIEITDDKEDELDLSNMYFDASKMRANLAKERDSRSPNRRAFSEWNSFMQDEPENLVIKPRASTPPPATPITAHTNYSIASSTLSQIAQSIHQTGAYPPLLVTRASPVPSVDLRSVLTAQFLQHVAVSPVNAQPSPPLHAYTSPTPILITPERYQPSPTENMGVMKQSKSKSGSASLQSVTPVSKCKIENIHNEQVDENKEYPCVEMGCNETYLGFSAYEDHCMIRHGRYPCKYCKQTFSGKNNRTRHMRCHLGAKTYTCPDCSKTFSRPDSMREHQFIHTLSYQEDKCRNCGSAFDKKNLLLAHLKACYRHKMETGKSTKFIDETPAYLNNTDSVASNQSGGAGVASSEDALAPLKPITLDSIPAFRHISDSPRTSPNQRQHASPGNLSSALKLPTVVTNHDAFPTPLVIVPTTTTTTTPTVNKRKSSIPKPVVIVPEEREHSPPPIAVTLPSENAFLAASLLASRALNGGSGQGSPAGASTEACANGTPISGSSSPTHTQSPTADKEQDGLPTSTTASSPNGDLISAVKYLVAKRKADEENKDQNFNTTVKKSKITEGNTGEA